MITASTLLFYVSNPPASAAFYEALLGRAPVESSPTFALFPLSSDMMLGLWARPGVEPAAAAPAGSAEIGFTVADRAAVDATHAAWSARGLTILQPPTEMDFGYTFTAADPDGHRLRVYVVAMA